MKIPTNYHANTHSHIAPSQTPKQKSIHPTYHQIFAIISLFISVGLVLLIYNIFLKPNPRLYSKKLFESKLEIDPALRDKHCTTHSICSLQGHINPPNAVILEAHKQDCTIGLDCCTYPYPSYFTAPTCERDSNTDCRSRRDNTECENNKRYMIESCPGFCDRTISEKHRKYDYNNFNFNEKLEKNRIKSNSELRSYLNISSSVYDQIKQSGVTDDQINQAINYLTSEYHNEVEIGIIDNSGTNPIIINNGVWEIGGIPINSLSDILAINITWYQGISNISNQIKNIDFTNDNKIIMKRLIKGICDKGVDPINRSTCQNKTFPSQDCLERATKGECKIGSTYMKDICLDFCDYYYDQTKTIPITLI